MKNKIDCLNRYAQNLNPRKYMKLFRFHFILLAGITFLIDKTIIYNIHIAIKIKKKKLYWSEIKKKLVLSFYINFGKYIKFSSSNAFTDYINLQDHVIQILYSSMPPTYQYSNFVMHLTSIPQYAHKQWTYNINIFYCEFKDYVIKLMFITTVTLHCKYIYFFIFQYYVTHTPYLHDQSWYTVNS